ncbi:hypothetical protein MOQ72_00285 [Saccharopolyspora sp. K220]|uniref:hypothetical protein n=1 Tax=Saccharopolyspora soli TaxID=2926618 RepID=UPI001F58B41A|nr:hypothetical protein [Saccharopolyspora soli]MCI2415847.1 hypothetical protein [Saccharopolyspora soli]
MRTRRYLAVGAATLACFSAEPASAAAATDPVTAASCTAVLDGVAGQGVLLDPRAVADPIAGALGLLDPLDGLREPFRQAWNAAPPIPVGAVPVGEAVLSGTQIADAAIARLREIPVVAPVLDPLIPAAHSALSTVCGMVVRGDQPGAPSGGEPPASPPPGPPSAPPPSNEAHWNAPGSSSDSSSRDVVRFGVPLTGTWPFGLDNRVVGVLQPGAPGAGGGETEVLNSQADLSAGRADPLPPEAHRPPLAALLAALLIALVSAQLVRTWVSRSKP